jgi:hypothetical protein
MKGAERTVVARASQPASVLEVVGHDIGHVYVSRAAADTIAPGGAPILPALVALIAAHKARQQPRTVHRHGDVFVCVITTASGIVVGQEGEHVGAA